jgi:hypothetical protein
VARLTVTLPPELVLACRGLRQQVKSHYHPDYSKGNQESCRETSRGNQDQQTCIHSTRIDSSIGSPERNPDPLIEQVTLSRAFFITEHLVIVNLPAECPRILTRLPLPRVFQKVVSPQRWTSSQVFKLRKPCRNP